MSTLGDRLKKIEKYRTGRDRKYRFVVVNTKEEETNLVETDNEVIIVLRLYE